MESEKPLKKTRIVHCKIVPNYDIYIGRSSIANPSRYGNKWTHKEGTSAKYKVSSREEAIEKHKEWTLTQPWLLLEIRQMKGKTLACWCKPLSCHGDTFVEIAEMSEEEFQKILHSAQEIEKSQLQVNKERPIISKRIPFTDF